MKHFLKIAAAAGALLATSIPALAVTENNPPPQREYTTELAPLNGFGLPFSGSMTLRVYSNGIVQGNYSVPGGAQFIPVTGGRDGNSIWFEIGMMGRVQFTGHYEHGKIVGIAYDRNLSRFGGEAGEFSFVATPA